jgi:hypothetical protein
MAFMRKTTEHIFTYRKTNTEIAQELNVTAVLNKYRNTERDVGNM